MVEVVKNQSMFSIRLKEKRKEANLTQQELASLLNINRVSYARWENGSREPNFKTLIELANILETTTDDLLGIKKT
ncbi:MAG: helix-turn-helix transcriptional regulator [Streptococcus hyointestinalis]|nr:helix-turn-helix transcriptional regulator [Streptococcus hyointestinalis]MDD7356073.1 helix-turn-helix transcriptional regulator [Streptococcus hyointestinalis]